MQRTRLCPVGTVQPGEVKRFEPDGMDPIALCNVDGVLLAVEDECTHAIASLSDGRLEGEVIYCPLHGGSFNVRTGKACTLPCKHPLRTFAVEIEDGSIWLAPKR